MAKININTKFWFGKHEGKTFKEIILIDRNYLNFLFRKGFEFDRDSKKIITENNPIETEISVKTMGEKQKVIFSEKKFIETGKTRIILCEKYLEKIDISDVPSKIIVRKIERHVFDSSAFQNDDRFYSYTDEVKTRIYDEIELQKKIKNTLKKYE